MQSRASARVSIFCVVPVFCSVFSFIGCNKSREETCATFKQKSIDSNWGDLTKEAKKCLTPEEDRLFSKATGLMLVSLGQGKTVGEILNEQRQVEETAKTIEVPPLPNAPQSTNQPKQPGESVKDEFSSVAEVLQRAVVFVYAADDEGNVNQDAASATGFIVSIPSKTDPKRNIFALLTGRHVVDRRWANCGKPNPSRLYIRMNKRKSGLGENPGVGFERIELIRDGQRLYAVPADDGIDAAVIILPPQSIPFQNYDAQFVPISIFATDDEFKALRVKDPIVTAGLVESIEKGPQTHNDPAFEQGFISDITKDKLINAYCQPMVAKKIRVWLIKPALSPGFSGAPIFTPVVRRFKGQLTRGPALIGLQSMRLGKDDPGGMTPVNSLVDVVRDSTRHWPEADLTRGFSGHQ